MALNEIAKHFYEKEVDRLLDLEDRNIVKEKFLDTRSQIDDLYLELGDRARRIAELESELETAEYAFNHIRDCSKSQFDKNEKQEKEIKHWRDEAQKQSWRVSELNRALCIKGDLLKKANEKIAELESELSAKEDLLKIKNGLCDEEPLPFSCDEYTDALFEELEDLRERHQQDCITINQLHTTIDTLIDRYAKLREMRGL